MILDTSQAFRFHRRYPIGWRLGGSSREYSPICQGNEYPANRRNTYSADTFDASKSPRPTHLEMHSSKQPSNELIQYVRRWEHELRLDIRNTAPRWPSERDVMKAACIVFLLRYETKKERRYDRLKEVLKALKTGLQADSRSSQPLWSSIQRRNIEKLIVRMEGTHAFKVAAVKQNEDDESQANRSCGKRNLCQIVAIILVLVARILKLLAPDFKKLQKKKKAFERVQKKAHIIDETVHCYRDPAHAMFAVEVSPLSAAYSDSLYETAGACGLRDEAIQHHAKYSKGGKSRLYVSECEDDEPGDKSRYYTWGLLSHERVNHIPGEMKGNGVRSSQASIESSDYVSKSSEEKTTKSKMRIPVTKLEITSLILVIDHHAL